MSQRLAEAKNPKIRSRLVQMIEAAVRGVGQNPTAGSEEQLVFIHSALDSGMAVEEASIARAKAAAQAAGSLPLPRKLLDLHSPK